MINDTNTIFSFNPTCQNNVSHVTSKAYKNPIILNSNHHGLITRSKASTFKPKVFYVAHNITLPKTVQQALTNERWSQSIKDEYDALIRNNIWDLVPYLKDIKVIDNNWLFRIKELVNGSLEKLKSRLVANGYLQVVGYDFLKKFSPMVKHATVKVFISISLCNKWVLQKLDISNMLFNGTLHQEVLMRQPTRFIDKAHLDYVYKLKKSLYELKQALRAWLAFYLSLWPS